MKNIRNAVAIVGILSFGMLTACGASSGGARTAADGDLSPDERDAALKIAEARCARQTPACGASLDAEVCIGRKLLPSAVDLDLGSCSSSVNQENLNACVTQIRAGRCGTGIVHIAACAHENICPGVAAEEGTI